MNKEVKVILLPQKYKNIYKGCIYKSGNDILHLSDSEKGEIPNCIPQYLHIIDDMAPIKEGNWIWFSKWNIITKMESGKGYSTTPDSHPITEIPKEIAGTQHNLIEKFNYNFFAKDCAKILASQDPELIANGVPSISSEFLQQYVACQGKCDVEMGVEEYGEPVFSKSPFDVKSIISGYEPVVQDNCVVLHIVEKERECDREVRVVHEILAEHDKKAEKERELRHMLKSAQTVDCHLGDNTSDKPFVILPVKEQTVDEAAMSWVTDNLGPSSIIKSADIRNAFKAGWQANPNKYTDNEIIDFAIWYAKHGKYYPSFGGIQMISQWIKQNKKNES